MKKFNVSADDRAAMIEHDRSFQGMVGLIASQKLGLEWHGFGIFKYEGGLVIGQNEVAIMKDCVANDWVRDHAEKPEEIAVAEAIEEVVADFKARGVAAFEGAFIAPNRPGDPLRSFFGLRHPDLP